MGGDTERGAVVNDDLHDRLRVSAEEFEPDRDRMWSRVSDGMRESRVVRAEPARSGWRVPLLAMATGAAVVLFGAIVVLGQTIGLGPVIDPSPNPPAVDPATRAPGVTTPADEEPETSAESATSDDAPEGGEEPDETATTEGPDAETGAEAPGDVDWLAVQGSIDRGSNDYWTQSNLVLDNEVRLSEVTVELRVAIGDGVNDTGSYSTNNTRFTEAVVTEEGGFLVYRWTLNDGQTLPADRYEFASQFTHEASRSADADTYRITATNMDGEPTTITGHFR